MYKSLFSSVIILLVIFLIPFSAHSQQIVIDHITNTWSDGGTTRLIPEKNIDFTIRYINNSGIDIKGMSNGFRVWTTGGSPFTPLNGEVLPAEFSTYFDAINGAVYSADGIGADTLSLLASAVFEGTGLPNGFNDLVLKLSTGGIQEGETLCIDSSWSWSGVWKWSAPGGINYYPSWSGPYCYTADCPSCIGSMFTNCVDTIKINSNSVISYQFEADAPFSIPVGTIVIDILEGPGTVDTLTGEWSYNVPPQKYGTYETLKMFTYNACPCWTEECWVVLDYNLPGTYGDLTGDGLTDISDLVFLVDFMFTQGPPPTPYLSGDLNGDELVDITDLVLLVDLLFGG